MEQKNRQHYEKLFSDQPDVLDTETVRQLLGGIAIGTVIIASRYRTIIA